MQLQIQANSSREHSLKSSIETIFPTFDWHSLLAPPPNKVFIQYQQAGMCVISIETYRTFIMAPRRKYTTIIAQEMISHTRPTTTTATETKNIQLNLHSIN